MKDVLKELFVSTLGELSLGPVMRSRIVCEDGVLAVGNDRFELAGFKKVIVVAVGKAAAPMAATFGEIVASRRVSGVIVTPVAEHDAPPYFLRYVGGHPYPNEQSVHGARVVRELVEDLNQNHLVVYLLSGGGSACFEQPAFEELSLADLQGLNRALVTCGADIVEMNVVRKHFSAVKGGRLAIEAHPARQVTLYVSDVPLDQSSSVASGPTMPDESTAEDCYGVIERRGLRGLLPRAIGRILDERRLDETPKPDDSRFANSTWHSLLDNSHAVGAVANRAGELGWRLETDLSVDDAAVGEAVQRLLGRLARLRAENPERPAAVLTGGELSCPVIGAGQGGRNQAFVLECVQAIAGQKISVISAGTDGIDGNSPAAGAVADGTTLSRAQALGMDPADFHQRSDSFHFFDRLGDALITGPTGNNVRDIRLLVAW